jgi:hypothetical protein
MSTINILLYELVQEYTKHDIRKNTPLPQGVQGKLDTLIEHIKAEANKRVR